MENLCENLASADLLTRHAAIEAAAATRDEAVIVALIGLLADPATGEKPRQAVAESLGKTGHPHAIACLLSQLQSADAILRGLAAIGLEAVQSAESVHALVAALDDKVNTVRNLAERSLLQMGPAVREHGVELLLAKLSHPVPLTRSPAARLVGLTGDSRALEPLLGLLQRDRQWLVRMWAAKGLGDLGRQEAFAVLAQAVAHDDKNRVRAAAAEAVGKLRHPESAGVLARAMKDEDGGVQKIAEEAYNALTRSSP